MFEGESDQNNFFSFTQFTQTHRVYKNIIIVGLVEKTAPTFAQLNKLTRPASFGKPVKVDLSVTFEAVRIIPDIFQIAVANV